MAKERFCFMDIHEMKDVINNTTRKKIHPMKKDILQLTVIGPMINKLTLSIQKDPGRHY